MDDDDDSDDADSDEEHIHQIAQRIQNNNNGGPITIDLSDLPDDEPNIPVVRPVQNGEVIELLD